MAETENNEDAESLRRSLDSSRRLLRALQCDLQVCKTVALNRLEAVHADIAAAARESGLSVDDCQALLGSIERSLMVLETDGRERLAAVE